MKEFESFLDAFIYAVDKTGLKHSDLYKKQGMDASQFSKYYNKDIGSPQGPTQNKLNELVGNCINKDNTHWVVDEQKLRSVHAQDYSNKDFNTELGAQVNEKILKYFAEVEKGNAGSLQDPVLSALRDQLESQKAMFEAQVKNIDSMILILDTLVRNNTA